MVNNVGITTLHGSYNFGAVLQAFALQRVIMGLGHPCLIINYRQPGVYPIFVLPCSVNAIKSDLLTLACLRSRLVMRKRYDLFRSRNLGMTKRVCRSIDDLKKEKLEFNVYVTGSDQVWNPNLLKKASKASAVYYLDFITSGRRVAYAPSFGHEEIPDIYRDQVSSYIRKFDLLSAREDTGCEIIRKLTSRIAEHVLDPTLLLPSSEYDKTAIIPSLGNPYILLFPMQASDQLNRMAQNVSKYLGLPIVAVLSSHHNPFRFKFADKVVFDAGPSEFLGWMKKAAFVCTNSYHGTCFSIIYRKSFLGVPCVVGNSRMLSLLKCLGLTARQVSEVNQLCLGPQLLAPLDYSECEEHLRQQVNQSLSYLKRALA